MSSRLEIWKWTADWAVASELKLWKALEATSTNSVAKNDSEEATAPQLTEKSALISEPSLYLSHHQTQGRGRGSNVWLDAGSGALLSSWSFSLRHVPQPILSPLVGLALFEAASHVWSGVAFNMKAPNDLYIGAKKVAGLLIETIDQGNEKRTIIGLGFNAEGTPNLETATDLASHLAQAITRKEWAFFLDAWVAKLKAAMLGGLSSYLNLEAREKLKVALNRHPLLKEPLLDVDAQGQLHSKSGIVSWQEL